MKYLTVPAPIKLGNDGEKDVYQTFSEWLANPLNGKPFGKDGSTLRMSCLIALRFEGKTEGDIVPLSKEEWERLHEAAEYVEGGFNTPVAKIFIPFMDAVRDVTDDDHKEDEISE